MDWKPLALSVPIFFVTYQALSKTLPKDISIFLVNAYASVVGVLVMLALHFLTSSSKPGPHGKYIWTAIGIGALISLGNFGIIKAFSLGAPQSSFSVIFYTALIVYSVLVGLLVWHESLKPIQIFGMALALVGIFLTAYFRK
jgi:drug/metabolite transporter (DMT)-like permease